MGSVKIVKLEDFKEQNKIFLDILRLILNFPHDFSEKCNKFSVRKKVLFLYLIFGLKR